MRTSSLPKLPAVASVLALVGSAAAFTQDVPQAVLIRSQAVPGVPGATLTGIDWVASNRTGGLVVNLSGSGAGFIDGLWGTLGGGTPGLLRTAGPIQGADVMTFRDPCSGAGERLVYIANVVGQPPALVVDDTIVAQVGDASVPGGGTWIAFSEPYVDLDGRPWFRGQYAQTGGGAVWGLFRGDPLEAVLLPGDLVPGLPGGTAYVGGGPDTGYHPSETGVHWAGVVRNSVGSREAIVIDGVVEATGGVGFVSWNAIPPVFEPNGSESWNHFHQVQILDDRTYAAIGYTPRGILIRDGGLFVRDGHVVDGFELLSGLSTIAMNESGGLAWICNVRQGGSGSPNAVFREREFLFREGDTVDIDGDGVPDPGNTVYFIPGGVGQLAYTEEGTVWVVAQLDTPSMGQPWALLAVGEVFGRPYCTSQPTSAGVGARIQAVGSPVVTENSLRLRCVDMPLNAFGYFLCSRTQGFAVGPGGSQGDLCLTGSVGRFNGQIVNSAGIGALEIPVNLHAWPQPTGVIGAVAGESWNFQCWFRDANPTVTSNFSDGIEVVLR